MNITLALSGGMDSVTLLGVMLGRGLSVHCVSFVYPSKHNQYETEAAKKIIEYYRSEKKEIDWSIVDLTGVFGSFKSNLLQGAGEIPEGHYEAENMKDTVVPGRNLIFGSIISGIAESVGSDNIALGVHAGDHHIYPDCRPKFIDAFKRVVETSTDGKVSVLAPFLFKSKKDILVIGRQLGIPYNLTRTCYKDQPIACGKCGSCTERLEAFESCNMKDPINYEEC